MLNLIIWYGLQKQASSFFLEEYTVATIVLVPIELNYAKYQPFSLILNKRMNASAMAVQT